MLDFLNDLSILAENERIVNVTLEILHERTEPHHVFDRFPCMDERTPKLLGGRTRIECSAPSNPSIWVSTCL